MFTEKHVYMYIYNYMHACMYMFISLCPGWTVYSSQRIVLCTPAPYDLLQDSKNNNLQPYFSGKGLPVMDFPSRLKIALGSAKGLAYLHEDCEFHIYIILDSNDFIFIFIPRVWLFFFLCICLKATLELSIVTSRLLTFSWMVNLKPRLDDLLIVFLVIANILGDGLLFLLSFGN